MKGLRRAEADEDGIVTLDALYRFVSDEVRRRNPQQTPRLFGDRAGEIAMAFVQPRPADALGPDGAAVWHGDSVVQGSMSCFELARGATSMAVMHRTVDEIWHVISGHGEMWRADEHGEEVSLLEHVQREAGTASEAIDDHFDGGFLLVVVPGFSNRQGSFEKVHRQGLDVVDVVDINDAQQLVEIVNLRGEPRVWHPVILSLVVGH